MEIHWDGLEPPRDKARREVEAEGSADAEVLRALSGHRVAYVRAAVARNAATPEDVLTTLVRDKHHLPRFGVAENPSPTAWAVALAAEDRWVRRILCRNPNIDDATIEALVRDPEHDVREGMATSSRRPDVLALLARDEHPGVRATAAINEALSVEDLELLARDLQARVRSCVAQSPRLSEQTVRDLSNDRSQYVRFELLHSHPDRRDLAQKFQNDSSELVRDLAANVLEPDEHMRALTRALVEGRESPWGIP